jgi:hypothetical protein
MKNVTLPMLKNLGSYENRTKKLLWYERYNEKCCIASVLPTQGGDKNLYKMKFTMSYDLPMNV